MNLALAVMVRAPRAAEPAFAGGRVRVGIFVGVPLFGFPYYYPHYYYPHYYYPHYYYPHYYYPPYYYPPYYQTTVVVPSQPTVYIEQGSQPSVQPSAQPQQQGYWYYCADSRAYYPYVRDCPGGWQRVAPQPNPG